MGIVSLCPLTLWDAQPPDFVTAAADAGFSYVGLRIVPPTADARIRPVMDDVAMQREIKARVRDRGLGLLEIEAFWLTAEFDCDKIMPALQFGAELRAQYVLIVGNDPDRARTIDNFGKLCAACATFGLRPALEFMPFSQVVSLGDAISVLDAAGQSNAGLLIDALHLSRARLGPDDIAAVPPSRIEFLHICDAREDVPTTIDALRHEARTDRLYPGEGALPLQAFLNAAPKDMAIGIEAPNARHAHLPLAERARLALRATMETIRAADVSV